MKQLTKMKTVQRFLLILFSTPLLVGVIFAIYIGIIFIQDALVSYSFQARGNSMAAEIVREVYATAYNKNKVRELIPNILACDNDQSCIVGEVSKLDKHMSHLTGHGAMENVSYQDKINYSQKAPDVLYVRFHSFSFDLTDKTNELVDPVLIPAVDFLLKAQPSQSVIIDLRDNGGGDTWTTLALASMFIPTGQKLPAYYNPSWKFQFAYGLTLPRVFTNKGIRGHIATSVNLPSNTKPQVKVIYVVVNEHTASGGEIFGIVLKKLSDQKIVFVGDSETYGVGNTLNMATEKYGVMVTAGIIREYPEKIVPEISIGQLEDKLGITLEN
jgi:hypothetical protein